MSRPRTTTNAKAKAKVNAKTTTKARASAKTRTATTRDVPPALLDKLVEAAKSVRANAYAPFSNYHVGAAIATKGGRIFTGCNVENSTIGATVCAERNAIGQMVAAGEREPVAVAVVTGDDGAAPCGICRQVLAEFALDLPVVMVGLGAEGGEAGRVVMLSELLPYAFRLGGRPARTRG